MNVYKTLLTAILSILLVACNDSNNDNTLYVATSADNPPYEHMRKGEIVGFDIDLINEIGQYLKKDIELKNVEFPGLLASLASRNVDLVIAAMSVTEERQKKVDFSTPYTSSNIAVLFRSSDAFKSEKDLKGKIVGAQLGTTWSFIAHELSLKECFEDKSLANNLMLVEELKNQRIDAVILEESQVQKFMEKNQGLASFPLAQYNSRFAITLPKNSALTPDINKAILALKSNGTIARLAQKWGLPDAQ